MTRDALLPILLPLAEAVARGCTLGSLVAALPARFTAADRLEHVATEAAQNLVGLLATDPFERTRLFANLGPEEGMDLTDGLRLTFASGEIIHLRPSGNAPELRCYAESGSEAAAVALVRATLAALRQRLA